MATLGKVHSFESFGAVDGPGIRFVVFLQGCPYRCLYCHNPDTWNFFDGETYSAQEIISKAMRFKEYWGKEGGITVSGGEPLAQIDFLIELFEMAKARNISTCIDTSGAVFTYEEPFFGKFEKLMSLTDLLLVDIKHIDDEKHIHITRHSRKNPKEMFEYLSSIDKPIWIRYVLVPGLTDDEDDLKATADFISSLNNVKKIDVLPYHSLGVAKYQEMNIPYPLKDVYPPEPRSISKAETILNTGLKKIHES